MPYNYFAESFNQLENLVKLVQRLEHLEGPLKELKDENYIADEFRRVKTSASKDVLIFGNHSYHYLRFHLFLVYDMMITLMELMRELPEVSVMSERDLYVYKHSSQLRSELESLALFYEKLSELVG